MDFQLIQGRSTYNPGCNRYDLDCDTALDPRSLPLDRIILLRNGEEIPIGGKANVGRMFVDFGAAAIVFALYAIRILVDPAFFMAEVKPPENAHQWNDRRGVEGFRGHFDTLEAGGVVKKLTATNKRKARFYSGYFSVAKAGDPPLARSIFNGKRFSLECNSPRPTNLPDFMRVLDALDSMVREFGAFSVYTSDIRHAFHQLPVNDSATYFFCIRLAEEMGPRGSLPSADWRWLTLPMGWAWSPLLCQSVGFGLLLLLLERCGVCVCRYKKMESPPAFIILFDDANRPVFIATLWYDNIGIFCRCPELFARVTSKLQKLFEKDYHYYLKEYKSHGPRDLNRSSESKPEYLGITFRFCRSRLLDGSDVPRLQWQVVKKKRDKWMTMTIGQPSNGADTPVSSTCRKVAGVLGVILWTCRLQYLPLCRKEAELRLLRRAGTCSMHGGWDTPMELSHEEYRTLHDGLGQSCRDEWFEKPLDITDEKVFVATDSSGGKWAYVVWQAYRSAHDQPQSGYWSAFGPHGTDEDAGIASASIFVKELLVATLAIENLTMTMRRKRIILFIDNTAAAGVCRRLASSTAYGNELARRIDAALSRSDCCLEVVTLLSAQNPADSPTRNKGMCNIRVEAMWAVWDDFQKGLVSGVPPRRAPTKEGLRHSEHDGAVEFDSEADEDGDNEWPDFSIEDDDGESRHVA